MVVLAFIQSNKAIDVLRAATVTASFFLLSGAVPAVAAGRVTSLIEAARVADDVAFQSLLQHGVDVDEAEVDGTTALHWAAHHGNLPMVTALLRRHASVDVRNRYGIAPLWLAALNGHDAVVEALLASGASPDTSRGDSGETVMMIAAKAGQVAVLQRLLAHGADPNAVDGVRMQTALMWAAAESHVEAVQLLLRAGANVEARSSTGLTPLMFAIRAGDISTTTALLDFGADLDAAAADGTTTLVLAMINAHWELASELLTRGADPNRNDPRGRPLHVLAFMRRAENRGLSSWQPRRPTGKIDTLDLAKALRARGANINDRLDYKNLNYNPTHMAISFFLSTSYVGATPLYIAAKSCDIEFVRFLVANGADPSTPTTQNITPLLAAAGVGYVIGEQSGSPEEALELVKLLAQLGQDIGTQADFGRGTDGAARFGGWNGAGAMHGAVIRGASELVQWLIDQSVPLDRKTATGETALTLARGSNLGVTYHVQPELADLIEKAMVVRGLPVPDHRYAGDRSVK